MLTLDEIGQLRQLAVIWLRPTIHSTQLTDRDKGLGRAWGNWSAEKDRFRVVKDDGSDTGRQCRKLVSETASAGAGWVTGSLTVPPDQPRGYRARLCPGLDGRAGPR